MRMTANDDVRSARCGRLVRTAATALLAGVLMTACSGGGDESAPVAKAEKSRQEKPANVPPPAGVDEKHARLATAVADSKTTAPIDMKYDVLAKPELGQPFEVELTFETRLPADRLEMEITESPGLTLVGETTAAFAPVEPGQFYVTKVLVQGSNAGLFYIGVTARLSTQLQSEIRAFAVPIVIGQVPSAQKTTPTLDSTGQAVKSMPAQEPK